MLHYCKYFWDPLKACLPPSMLVEVAVARTMYDVKIKCILRKQKEEKCYWIFITSKLFSLGPRNFK